ncbi:MAG: translocation/assembly module TamB domain-containing protein [Candidatus Alcyoniella australis]|nr:translocation/assembly module TamB domain-containing protein [Candidatus Alcyoniella australis]
MARTERKRRSRWWLLIRIPIWLTAALLALAMVLLLTVNVLLRSEGFNSYLLGKVLPPLNQKINARIEVGGLYVSLLPIHVIVQDAVFTAIDDDSPRPFASVELVDAKLDLHYLMLGQIHISEVLIKGADCYLLIDEQGLENLPKFPSFGPPEPREGPPQINFPLTIKQVILEDVSFGMYVRPSEMRLELPQIRGSASCDLLGSAYADLTLLGATFDLGEQLHERVDRMVISDTEFRFPDWTAKIGQLQIELPDGTLSASGKIRDVVGSKTADIALRGELDLAHARAFVSDPSIEGRAQIEMRMTGDLPEFTIAGTIASDRIKINQLVINDLKVGLEVGIDSLRANSLRLRTAGGLITGTADLRYGEGAPLRAMLNLNNVDLETALHGYGVAIELGGAASGFVRVDGPLSPLDLNLDTILALVDPRYGPSKAPLIAPRSISVAANVRLTQDGLKIKQSRMAIEDNQVRASGAVGFKAQTIELAAELDMPHLAALGPVAGNDPAGALQGQARLSGALSAPDIALKINGDDLVYGPYRGGDLAGSIELRGKRLEIAELTLLTDRGEFRAHGGLTLAAPYPLDVEADIINTPLADLLAVAGQQLELEGLLEGRVVLKGDLERPSGAVAVTISDGAAYGERFEKIEIYGLLDNGLLDLHHIRVHKEQDRMIVARGLIDLPGRTMDLKLMTENFRVEDLDNLRSREIAVAGDLSLVAMVKGTFSEPQVEARVALSDALYSQMTLGDSTLDIKLDSSGALAVEGTLVNERIKLGAGGALLGDDPRIDLELSIDEFDMGPYLEFGAAAQMYGVLSAVVRVGVPLKRTEQLEAQVDIEKLSMGAADFSLQNMTPINLSYAQGRIDVQDFELGGKGVRSLTLTRAQVSPQLVGFYLAGDIDIEILHAFVPMVADAQGALNIDLWVTNDFSNFKPEGTLRIEGGQLEIKNFPQPVQDLRAIVNFDRDRVNLEVLSARVGAQNRDPNLSGSGQVMLEGFSPKKMRFLLSINKMITGYAPDLDVKLDSLSMLLQGEDGRYEISGEINVDRAVYTKDIDLISILQSFRSRPPSAVAIYQEQEPFVDFNVAVHAPDELIFFNNVAKIELGGDLILTGDNVDMGLLGHLFLVEGRADVLGNSYEISSVSIQFYEQARIWPNFEVNAETTVQDVNILVNVHGDPDNVDITFNSDPPKGDQDIISLLTLGMSYDEFQSGEQVSTEQALGWTANKIIGDRLNKIAGRYTGISVAVDTSGGRTRIVISKELGKDLVASLYRDVIDTEMGAELEYGFIRYLKVRGLWSSRTNPDYPQSYGSLGAGLVLTIEFQ